MTKYNAAPIMMEACYRLAALHHAGIADYNSMISRLNYHEERLGKGKWLPPNPYDIDHWMERQPYVDMIVEAYHATIEDVLKDKGVQLDIFGETPDLEGIITKHRVKKDKGNGQFFIKEKNKK